MKHNLPLTYGPKIRGVVDGTVRQTIRICHKYAVGDLVSFYGWEGVPYRSKWSFRTPYFELSEVIPITLYPGGIEIEGIIKPWSQLDDLAAPPWCRGCPHPIYDDRRGEWDWYCRQHSPTGIRCTNVAVLRERCYRVWEYFAKKEVST